MPSSSSPKNEINLGEQRCPVREIEEVHTLTHIAPHILEMVIAMEQRSVGNKCKKPSGRPRCERLDQRAAGDDPKR